MTSFYSTTFKAFSIEPYKRYTSIQKWLRNELNHIKQLFIMIDKLITFYLDFKNSQMSINNYAAKHEISCSEYLILLDAGKKLNERPIENIAAPFPPLKNGL